MDQTNASVSTEKGDILALPDHLLNLITDFLPLMDYGRFCQACSRFSSNVDYIESRLERVPWSLVAIRSHVGDSYSALKEFELYLGVQEEAIIHPRATLGCVYIDRVEGWGGLPVKESLRYYPDVMVNFSIGDFGVPYVEDFSRPSSDTNIDLDKSNPVKIFLGNLDKDPIRSEIYEVSGDFRLHRCGWFRQKEVVDSCGEKRGIKRPVQVLNSNERPPKKSRLVLVDSFWADIEESLFDDSEDSDDDYDY